MTKDEALDLALEALETIANAMPFPVGKNAITAIKQARSAPVQEQDLREELDATNRQVEILSDALAESRREVAALKINAALNKKAENARELGLDYEPPCKTGSQCTSKCQQCVVQEPVAVVSGYYGGQCVVLPINPARLFNSGTAFYTTPPAAQSSPVCTRSHPHENMDSMCELRTEIARLTNENARLKAQPAPVQPSIKQGWDVDTLLDKPAAQRQWVGLTDEAIWSEYQTLWPFHPAEEPRLAKDIAKFARAIEAKLRSKNT